MPKRIVTDSTGVIYARFSSHNQRDESIEQQVKECRAHAESLGISIVAVYDDHAVSGKTDSRPQFQKMMRDAQRSSWKYVIAWKSNRMGRNMLQAMVNEARLNDLGIKCLYVEEDFDDTAAGRFALRNMMNVNQFYSENMAEDIRRGLRDNAEKCKVVGAIPYGYKRGEDGQLSVDPDRAAIVSEIFERITNGESYLSVAADMNARGLRTSRGGEWNRSSFHRMMSNRRYTGVYIYDDIEIPNGIPRIISDEMFEKAQGVINIRKHQKGRASGSRGNPFEYLLTGKLYCGHCKSFMTGLSGTGKSGGKFYYYTCSKRRRDNSCDKENVPRDLIENAVANAVSDNILSDDKVMIWIAEQIVDYSKRASANSNIGILEEELQNTEKSISNLLKALEMGIITETTKARMQELEKQRKLLQRKIIDEKAKIVEVDFEDVYAWLSMFRDKDISDKEVQRLLFDTFIHSVYVYDDTLKIVFSYTGEENSVDVPLAVESIDSIGMQDTSSGCSTNSPLAPPNVAKSNTGTIYMIGPVFVLVCHICQ